MKYTGISGNSLTPVTRGKRNTTPAAHTVGGEVLRGNTYFWNPAPTNVIGKSYLDTYVSGSFSAVHESQVTNYIPRGYVSWDAKSLWHFGDGPAVAATGSNRGDYSFSRLAPSGVQYRPEKQFPYKVALDSIVDGSLQGNTDLIIDTSVANELNNNSHFALKVTSNGGSGGAYTGKSNWVTLGANGNPTFGPVQENERNFFHDKSAIKFPRGRKWILSYYIKTDNNLLNAPGISISLADTDDLSADASALNIYGAPGINSGQGGGVLTSVKLAANNVWERRYVAFNLSNTTHDVFSHVENQSAFGGDPEVAIKPQYAILDTDIVTSTTKPDSIHQINWPGIRGNVREIVGSTTAYAANLNSMIIGLGDLNDSG